MALTEEKRPYEFLARWDTKTGILRGAHVIFADVVLRDGEFVSETIGVAQPIDMGMGTGFPLADILKQLQITALRTIEQQRAAHAAELKEKDDKQQAERVAHLAELQAERHQHAVALAAKDKQHAAELERRNEAQAHALAVKDEALQSRLVALEQRLEKIEKQPA